MISFAVEFGLFRYVCAKLRLYESSKFSKKPSSSQVKYALLVEQAGAQHRNRTSALSLEVRDKLLKAQGYRFKPFTALNRAFGTKRTDSLSTIDKNQISVISQAHQHDADEDLNHVKNESHYGR